MLRSSRLERISAVSADSAYDVPLVAVNAYQFAAAVMRRSAPSCHLSWTMVAAIGAVESDHGRFGGAEVLTDGTTSPRIVGVPLDGRGSVAKVRDTDHGKFDGDVVWDRAVGPLQFLPSTWAIAGVDADQDGVRNPFDFNDAALATASYLCAGAGDLRVRADARAAVYRYNHSQAYVDAVLSIAAAYDRDGLTIVSDLVLPQIPELTAPHSPPRHRAPVFGINDRPTARHFADGANADQQTDSSAHARRHADRIGVDTKPTPTLTARAVRNNSRARVDRNLDRDESTRVGVVDVPRQPSRPAYDGSSPPADDSDDPASDPTPDPTQDPPADPTPDPTTDPPAEPTPPSHSPDDPSSDPTPEPTPDPTPVPTPDPCLSLPEPKPIPTPDDATSEPEPVRSAGVLTMCDDSWWLDDVLLDLGDNPDLSLAQVDYDGDTVDEPVIDELTALIDSRVRVLTEGDGGLVLRINRLDYVAQELPADSVSEPTTPPADDSAPAPTAPAPTTD